MPRWRLLSAAEQTRRELSLPLPPATAPTGKSSPPVGVDPFEAALFKCSSGSERRKKVGGRRRTIAQRFGFLGLHGSCMEICSVVDTPVYLPHSGRHAGDSALLGRRSVSFRH